ncbi:hypothetical protein Scep_009192 [Stephania cephalantha]|uniref:F-box domain-containing protein n=1 Tax=Stephania cephalantha TaxID=152367 RepID=A0AAP0PG21_9MAGN
MDQYPNLPDDILHVIVNKLTSLVCHGAFRSVCRSWRSFSLQHYFYLVLPHQPPWLMCPKSVNPPSRLCDLYTLDGTKQFFQFEFPKGCNLPLLFRDLNDSRRREKEKPKLSEWMEMFKHVADTSFLEKDLNHGTTTQFTSLPVFHGSTTAYLLLPP